MKTRSHSNGPNLMAKALCLPQLLWKLRFPLHRLSLLLVILLGFMHGISCSSKKDATSSLDASSSQDKPSFSILRAGNRYVSEHQDHYLDVVQPVLTKRCVGCHSCTNGPCQLNMTSFAALERGLSSTNPYSIGLADKRPTRVSDNLSLKDWRAQGFHSVLPQAGTKPEDSLFFKSLELGSRNVASLAPGDSPLTESVMRSLAKAQVKGEAVCPIHENKFADLEKKYPMGGMPWGLPSIETDHEVLERWVLSGAKGPSSQAQAALESPQKTALSLADPASIISRWEDFLDADDLRSQLVARYIYEHSASANVHFLENPGEFYRLVRSSTVAPAAISRIQTDLPQDAPGISGRVYYRFEKIDRIIEGKTHVPWELSFKDLARFKELFLGSAWTLTKLPDYASKNPFEVFEAIPAIARSRFMLENSRMLFAAFARGPICLVQAATYAVDDHFWIWFVKPESDPSVLNPRLGLESYDAFFNKDGNPLSGVPVLGDKYGEPVYRQAFESELRRLKPNGLGLQDLWNGEGTNPNAWLTVQRNQFSVDVHTTWERPTTGQPKSLWLMTYSNFERMYYNAVSQYKYWGGVRHQNDSFSWQILTRTEAEDLYASLFPDQAYRDALRNRFTSQTGRLYYKMFKDYALGRPSASPEYKTEDALGKALAQSLGKAFGPEDRLNHWPKNQLPSLLPKEVKSNEDFETGLRYLTAHSSKFGRYFPNVVHLRLGQSELYTLLAIRGYNGDKIPFTEDKARVPAEDTVVAVPGFSAFEAHMFIDLAYDQAPDFLQELAKVQDQTSWSAFAGRYKIARNSPNFWPFVDWLHDWLSRNHPVRGGILELRPYDMDETPF